MSKWRPVILFKCPIDLRILIGVVIAGVLFLNVFKYCNRPTPLPIAPIDESELVEEGIHLYTVLWKNEYPARWDVRYELVRNKNHPKGYVSVLYIRKSYSTQNGYYKAWWRVVCDDPSGRTAVGYRDGRLSEYVTLDNKYFRQAYRTAEAIIWAYNKCEKHELYIDKMGILVPIKRVIEAKERMLKK